MPPDLFTAVTPRPDVLAGDLGEEIFAANLDEVAAGTAPEVYGDPQRFFASTHASRGLRELLDQVFGRLSGVRPDNASVLRLETNLGGGKTHNLIGLLHTARGLAPEHAAEFMDPALLPAEPVQAIGVFVGTSSGATDFPVRDGIKPRTIWGHLALQLGGAAAYAHIREDDEHLSARPPADAGSEAGDELVDRARVGPGVLAVAEPPQHPFDGVDAGLEAIVPGGPPTALAACLLHAGDDDVAAGLRRDRRAADGVPDAPLAGSLTT